jgi:hypothetical protein
MVANQIIMTPKQKAEQLVNNFRTVYHTKRIKESSGKETVIPIQIVNSVIHARIYALVAVDELIQLAAHNDKEIFDFLEDVKQEIEKL